MAEFLSQWAITFQFKYAFKLLTKVHIMWQQQCDIDQSCFVISIVCTAVGSFMLAALVIFCFTWYTDIVMKINTDAGSPNSEALVVCNLKTLDKYIIFHPKMLSLSTSTLMWVCTN
jgi:uncharacterized membrane protein YqhA